MFDMQFTLSTKKLFKMVDTIVDYKRYELEKVKFYFQDSPSVMNSSFEEVLNTQSDNIQSCSQSPCVFWLALTQRHVGSGNKIAMF